MILLICTKRSNNNNNYDNNNDYTQLCRKHKKACKKKFFFSRNHNANMAGTFWFDNGGPKGFFHVKLEGMVLGNIFGGDEPPLPDMANLYHLNCLFIQNW